MASQRPSAGPGQALGCLVWVALALLIGGGFGALISSQLPQPDAAPLPPDDPFEAAPEPSLGPASPSASSGSPTASRAASSRSRPPIASSSSASSSRSAPPTVLTIDLDSVLAQIGSFTIAWRFEAAVAELEALSAVRLVPSQRLRVREELERARGYLALLDKLARTITSGSLHGFPMQRPGIKVLLRLRSADRDGLSWQVGEKGRIGETWSNLSVAERWRLMASAAQGREERWLLASLVEAMGSNALAEKTITPLWKHEANRQRVNREVARLRGEPLPARGYAYHGGQLVSWADKAQLDKGLVRWGDSWVSKKDRKHLRRGHVKIDGEWVARTPEQLRRRGYVERDGRWIGPRELARLQKRNGVDWSDAIVRRTKRWEVRTNYSESLADQVAAALERHAYAAFERHLGVQPRGTRPLRVYAFKGFEEYRAYCQKIGKTGGLAAAGFSPSEDRTCCAWDKLKRRKSFLQTIMHEACHLYAQESGMGRLPSWLAEGMATYFEGFDISSSGNVRFHHKPPSRLRTVKAVLGTGDEIPLGELSRLSASQLLKSDARKTIVFYAQCWGYYAFFQQPRTKAAFDRFLQANAKGARPDLAKELGMPLSRIEAEFRRWARKQ